MMENLIDIDDPSMDDIDKIYRMTEEMKEFPQSYYHVLEDKTLLMLFTKPSTRTRISFETGMTQMGGHGIYFTEEHSQISRGESMKDTAKVVSRYVDGIVARVHAHDDMLALAEYADVPVVNGLTDRLHPCQALADMYTLKEKVADVSDLQLVFVGDGNNVAHSVMQACARLGTDFTISCPQGYEPDQELIDRARAIGEETGATIKVVHDPHHAVSDADVLYTDVWVSMGDEEEQRERIKAFRHYQVDMDLVNTAGNPYVMHPLPAHRGQEITSDVMDSTYAIVYDQAENRLHVQKAALYRLMHDRAASSL
jgi:ornithine carbamoyltransferase